MSLKRHLMNRCCQPYGEFVDALPVSKLGVAVDDGASTNIC